MDVGYPGGKTNPFAVVSAFWRFSYPGAASEVQLKQQLPPRALRTPKSVPLGSGWHVG